MPRFDRHSPGSFCWAELVTSDAAGAKRFYADLLGWQHHDDPIGPDRVYTMLLKEGDAVAALYQLNREQREQGVPSHWGQYVSVAHIERVTERVWELGGQVLAEPFDVARIGRMAVLRDPQGAYLSLWQPRQQIGARRLREPGAMCWNELMTTDTEKAGEFHSRLFDWERRLSPMGGTDYTVFEAGGRPVAGMMAIDPAWGEVPPHWLVYFQVADCARAVAAATAGGGSTLHEPTAVPGVGRFAILRDPQGAVLGILEGEAAGADEGPPEGAEGVSGDESRRADMDTDLGA